ncbi:hypothetical protein F2Q70_00013831 [Brassica cretica]|uniref:Protein kinase domain-containing protein n=1 Tax=Brassica cretica TaxID=69181 RepID=A0A8S9M9N9_BRACR|nr:hypothetical protein F2Q70_00013831 [Brassica cretica]
MSGDIPSSFGNLSMVTQIYLYNNDFKGSIPSSLDGPVPTEGIFQKSRNVSVFGNKNLCGGGAELKLKPCLETKAREHSSTRRKIAIGVGAAVTLFILSVMVIISLSWFKKRNERVRYGELHSATGGFSLGNMIGTGNFGVVYKAFLGPENRAVAIKVLNLKFHGAAKSFIAECEVLKSVRHRNLVKLLTVCSSIDFKGDEFRALVYKFMPNGSLDMWLHGEDQLEGTNNTSRPLSILERFNIAIDVASAVEYLHVNYHDPIVHCDLKPGNVLLDDDLTAHVSDFGLARLLLKFDQQSSLSSSSIRGTIGYAAPGKHITHVSC